MQVQITLQKLEFLKPYRFFVLVKTPHVTKRTEIADYTQTPSFANKTIAIGQPENIQVSACIVLDYTGRLDHTGQTLVFGRCDILKEEYQAVLQSGGTYEQQKEFVQETNGGRLVIGHFKATIKQSQSESTSSYVEDISEFRMQEEAADQAEAAEDKSTIQPLIRFDLHCGTQFPGDSAFFVQLGWAEKHRSPHPKYLQTSRMIQNEMNPIWREQLILPLTKGLRAGFLIVLLKDKDGSLLEQASFEIAKLQPFYHYHAELETSEEVKHIRPKLFMSFVLQSVPEKSLTEQICQLSVTNIEMLPEVQANKRFFIALSSTPSCNLSFNKLAIKKDGLAEANFIENCRKNCANYFLSPMLVSPVVSSSESDETHLVFRMRFLKSNLLKQNYLMLFDVPQKEKMPSVIQSPTVISTNCTAELRSVFYDEGLEGVLLQAPSQGKKQSGELRCLVQLGCEAAPLEQSKVQYEPLKTSDPLYQRWKALSNDTKLKQRMIHSMRKETEERSSNIAKKGDGIQALRRAERELSERNRFLVRKLQQTQSIRITEVDEKIKPGELYDSLMRSAEQLQLLIGRNNQLTLKLEAAQAVEEPELNTARLEEEHSKNRFLIQEMRERLGKLSFYNDIIRRQKQSILKLQKLFEQSQIDSQMNEILDRQLKELQGKKPKRVRPSNMDELKLTGILEHMKQQKLHKASPEAERVASLRREIAQAEDELRRKSEYFARLQWRSGF